ncbi:RNA pseudouridine synthase 1 [Sesamum angolense]|uniref:RNA pseudouridine synthase 1 n=1 Tax=Sesamum angolense TaxID=2727404 RepID=A0AAE2BLU8_9LAMI|nr:RNA pseudouridine synthase 1 [Sesamum angolense]
MTSFGEGYATRSDEEGFRGIYVRNQYVVKDNDDKNAHADAPEFDQNQGSEVKEKEKARNQSKLAFNYSNLSATFRGQLLSDPEFDASMVSRTAPKWENIIIQSGHGGSRHGAWVASSGSERHGEKLIAVEEKSEITCDADKAEVVVKAHPRSGRTHQIPSHCQYLGIPIIYEGHELHAESLCFEHPVTSVMIQAISAF